MAIRVAAGRATRSSSRPPISPTRAASRVSPPRICTWWSAYTRIGPKTIQWDVTVTDPSTWTKPWTATVLLRSTPDPIFEMACHEGNEGLAGALSGHRALENAATTKARDSLARWYTGPSS